MVVVEHFEQLMRLTFVSPQYAKYNKKEHGSIDAIMPINVTACCETLLGVFAAMYSHIGMKNGSRIDLPSAWYLCFRISSTCLSSSKAMFCCDVQITSELQRRTNKLRLCSADEIHGCLAIKPLWLVVIVSIVTSLQNIPVLPTCIFEKKLVSKKLVLRWPKF